jgi:hypothetical protein
MGIEDERWTLGQAAEEPDTYLIGDHGLLWCRVIGTPDKPAEPRARLMKAAPQLLAIAKLWVASYHASRHIHESERPAWEYAIAKTQAVIAEATGT